jgi:hypothetical protein
MTAQLRPCIEDAQQHGLPDRTQENGKELKFAFSRNKEILAA